MKVIKRLKRIIPAVLALCTLCFALPARAAVFQPDIRVLLSTSGNELTLKVTGDYTVREAPELKLEKEVSLTVSGNRPVLTSGSDTLTQASITLESPDYGGVSSYIILRTGNGRQAYLGNLRIDVSQGKLRVINTLPIEKYLYGVVPHEMSNTFPLEALKAQAVCARGYAVAKCSAYRSRVYDILDTSEDQVYKGFASKNTRAIQAVDETAGQVLTYESDIVSTYYSASNGGQTELTGNVWKNDLPYYIQQDDPFDLANPSSLEDMAFIPLEFTEETVALMDAEVLSLLQEGANAKAGEAVTLQNTVWVKGNSAKYDPPSRSYTQADVILLVSGSRGVGQVTVSIDLDGLVYSANDNPHGVFNTGSTRLRMRGAEPGTLSTEDGEYPGFFLTNRRYGHGIGLSQRGAQQRATSGQSYAEMLAFYYVNTSLVTVGSFDTAPALSSDKYVINSWGISGVKPGTDVSELLSRFSAERGTLSIVSSSGAEKTEGRAVSGDYLRNTYDESCFFDLTVVIFGDLDGNGRIDEDDVSALQRHLSGEKTLSGACLLAADTDRNGSVELSDLVKLIKHINGDYSIQQGE